MQPPFCPNPRCSHHRDSPESYLPYWKPAGFYTTLVVGVVMRFRCSSCGKGFSERTFSIDYYTKRTLDLHEIHRALSQSESLSSVARHLGCSVDSVQNRADRLGRAALALHTDLTGELRLAEHLVADGFESFDRSQYFPNQINILVGKKSQFLYAATHTTIRRKGRMTPGQQKMRHRLERVYRAPPRALEQSFARALEDIPAHWNQAVLPHLELWTDEHQAYPRAIAAVPALRAATVDGSFVHRTCPSKAPRNLYNPLFPVNYYDRELRKDIAAFRRESTCFTRNVANGLLRFSIHMAYHNYQKRFRVHDGTNTSVHAAMAGIAAERVDERLAGFYEQRPFLSKVRLNTESRKIWLKTSTTPLKVGPTFVPAYARLE
ncbi:MAG TPA: hypothetical protein VMX33_09760 [bacterium]|nr:hypothetical protein [bacterium]